MAVISLSAAGSCLIKFEMTIIVEHVMKLVHAESFETWQISCIKSVVSVEK